MVTLLKRFLGFWKADATDEYYRRFIQPPRTRLKALGVSDAQADQLFQRALALANPLVVGQAPGSILWNFADAIEDGQTVEQILAATRQD